MNDDKTYYPIKGEFFGRRVDDGDFVTLVARPENKFDHEAIEVLDATGLHIGWLPRGTGEKGIVGTRHAKVVWKGRMGVDKTQYEKWDNKDYSWIVLLPDCGESKAA